MRNRMQSIVAGLMAVSLALVGCGGDGGTTTPEEGHGRIVINVNWPKSARSSRLVMTTCQSVKVIVTGAGIETPPSATLNKPEQTAVLEVPAGNNRLIDAQGFDAADAGGNQIQKAFAQTIAELAAGVTYEVPLYLGDLRDPDDSTSAGATPVPTDGSAAEMHTMQRVTQPINWLDRADWFRFSAIAGRAYTVKTQDCVGATWFGSYHLRLYGVDGATPLQETSWTPWDKIEARTLVWTAPADGDYYVALEGREHEGAGGNATFSMEYRLSVTEDGSGSARVTVN